MDTNFCELSADELDNINGGGVNWKLIGKLINAIGTASDFYDGYSAGVN